MSFLLLSQKESPVHKVNNEYKKGKTYQAMVQKIFF